MHHDACSDDKHICVTPRAHSSVIQKHPRLVSWFFRKHYSIAFHGIFGIVLASTLVIIPTSYVGAWEIVLSAVCCIGGFLLAYFMARLDRRIQENGRA